MEARQPISSCLLGDAPGVQALMEGVPWEQYLTGTIGINPSTIVHGRKSMLDLKHAWDCPRPDTDAFLWGRAIHALLFEPKSFEDRFRPFEGQRRGSNWEEFAAQCFDDGAEPIPSKMFHAVLIASLSFVHDPIVQSLISAGQREVVLMSVEGGLQCRGRVDWISTSEHSLVDLKSAKDIEARSFAQDFYRYGYDVKLGLYRRWLERLTGQRWPVEVVAIEKTPPYDVAVVPIAEAVLDRGAEKGLAILRKVEHCIRTDCWPGVAEGKRYRLDTPVWEMDDEELEGAEEVTHE